VHQYNTSMSNLKTLSNLISLEYYQICLPVGFKKNLKIWPSFNVRNGFNDVNALVERVYFTNFNSLSRGMQIENSLITSHRLNYSSTTCTWNFTTILQTWGMATKDPLVNGFLFRYYSTSDRLNLDAEMWKLNGNVFYSKSFLKVL
jgi:hypothetical protein